MSLFEIAGDHPLRPAGVAAHPDADQLGHQHRETDRAVGDPLLGHLDRGDIAGLAQHGRGAVAYLADRGDPHLLPDEAGVSGAQLLGGEAAQILEHDIPQGEADVRIVRPVERAGRALDVALDGQPGGRGLAAGGRGAVDLLAGRRDGLAGRELGESRAGRGDRGNRQTARTGPAGALVRSAERSPMPGPPLIFSAKREHSRMRCTANGESAGRHRRPARAPARPAARAAD